MKKIAVIVINYNGKHHLKECLSSLLSQAFGNFEVYLLDNASSDNSVEYTSLNFPIVKIIGFERNYGFAEGYNKAIAKINAEYIVLLNSDTRTDNSWLKSLVEAAEEDKNAAIVGSKICFYHNPDIINSAGVKLTFAGVGFDIGFGLPDQERFNKKQYTGAVCGASMLVKKEVFEKLGGFDNNYFILCEDTDLCWRAWLAGYKVAYQPDSIVYHKFGNNIGARESPLRIFYSQRNAILTLIKNMGVSRLIISISITLTYTFLKLILYALLGKTKNFKSLFYGTLSVIPLIKSSYRNRIAIQRERTVSDRFLEKMGLMSPLKESFLEYIRVSKLWLGITR